MIDDNGNYDKLSYFIYETIFLIKIKQINKKHLKMIIIMIIIVNCINRNNREVKKQNKTRVE